MELGERDVLAGRAGTRVEAWVYLYASRDRAVVYPELAPAGPLRFRDRFTGETSLVGEDDAAVFAELTAATELDIITVNPTWGAEVGPGLLGLMRSARLRLNKAACDAWVSAADIMSMSSRTR